MFNKKRILSLLLVMAMILSSFSLGFGRLKSEAANYGTFRIHVRTISNGIFSWDRGTYDDVYIYFWSENNATGTMIYKSGNIDGVTSGGDEASTNLTVPATATIKSIQIQKENGTDDWYCDYWEVYYTTPAGEVYIGGYNESGDDVFSNNPSQENFNTSWFSNHIHTFTFNAGGGTGGSSKQLVYGASPLDPPTVEKTGYTLSGWNPAIPSNAPDVDTTYTAQWTPKQYLVNFDAQGGTAIPAEKWVDYASTYGAGNVWPIPVREGHTFEGWYTENNGAGTKITSSTIVRLTTAQTLYAHWIAGAYTINYYGNGSTSGITEFSVHIFNVPSNLTLNGFLRYGHKFQGWAQAPNSSLVEFHDADSVTNVTAIPNGTVSLYAIWSPNDYKLTYNANGGSGSMPAQTIAFGSSAALNTIAFGRTGYSFKGWAVSQADAAAGIVSFNNQGLYTMSTEGATVYAVWNANAYQITFNANGGTGGTVTTMHYGDPLSAPTVSRVGYQFTGWSPYVPASVSIGDATYTAQWRILSYTIFFDANGGTGGWATPHTLTYGATLTAPTVTKTNYIFSCWSPVVPATVPAENTTYIAQWTPKNYNITFDANGGTGTTTLSLGYNTPLTAPPMARTGYTLTGWEPSLPTTVPGANTIYKAQWSKNSYYITFNANGGTGGTGPILMQFGDPLVAPTVEFTGNTFNGWSPAVPLTVPAENMTYYAQWIPPNTFHIVFDANGGVGGTDNYLDSGEPLQAPVVTRDGYDFDKWLPDVPSTVPAEDKIYIAQWLPKQYYVSYNANGGMGYVPDIYQDCGSSVALISTNFSKTGNTFIGWNTSSTATTALESYYVPAHDSILYAVYTPKSYYITFNANGGEGGIPATLMTFGTALAAPSVTWSGHRLTGWSPKVPTTVPAQDKTYVAQWVEITSTVSFDLNGGEGTVPDQQQGSPGSAIWFPPQGDIIKQYCNFLGWATSQTADTPLSVYELTSVDATLFAVWERIPVSLTVKAGSTAIINQSNGFIYGLDEGISQTNFKNNFVQVLGDGVLLITFYNGSFGTGTKVQLKDNVTEEILQTYYIVIFGDVDGDGNVTGYDANLIGLVSSYQITFGTGSPFSFAADITQDGQTDAFDLNIVRAAEKNIITINQTNPGEIA